MRIFKTSRLTLMAAVVTFLGACDPGEGVGPEFDAQFSSMASTTPGVVFTMTNEADNAVAMFRRGGDGTLSYVGSYATGGMGTGDESVLGNQGAIAVGQSRRYLFVVNPASDDVTSFRVGADGLEWAGKVPSGGEFPVSITTYGDLVYVLNAGGSGSIQGFEIEKGGSLSPIPGAWKPLSGAEVTAAAQIAFSGTGGFLAVSEKATNLIDIYTVDGEGLPSDPYPQASEGTTPFGLGFGLRDQLIVSEAFGGAPGQASASSYNVASDGTLYTATGVLGNGQTAACWAAVTPDGRLAYTANTPSNNLSGYRIAADGSLTLAQTGGISGVAQAGDLPKDLGFSHDGQYLYSVNVGTGTIGMFAIETDGSLTHLGNTDAVLPAGVVNGIAAW